MNQNPSTESIKEPKWHFWFFIGLMGVQLLVGFLSGLQHPGCLYDEIEHLKDIVSFANFGWSDKVFQNRNNYAGTLSYYIPSLFYKYWPSLIILRIYAVSTTVTAISLIAYILKKRTHSWLPGILLLSFPHAILYHSVFLTEGTSMLLALFSFLFFQKAVGNPDRGVLYSAISGMFLAIAILHRQLWLMQVGGLFFVVLLSEFRKELAKYRLYCLMTSMVALAGIVFFTYLAGGIFIGGTKIYYGVHVSYGNWLLSFLCFLPFYGLYLYGKIWSPDRIEKKTLGVLLLASIVVAGSLSSFILSHDEPYSWLGHGPLNRLLSMTPPFPKVLAAFIITSSILGLFLLLLLLVQSVMARSAEFAPVFLVGSLLSLAAMISVMSFSTTFYERYMLHTVFCVLMALPYKSIGQTRNFWYLQIAFLLLLQVGVFHVHLGSVIFYH